MYLRLPFNSLCRWTWSWTSGSLSSTSPVLGLLACITMPGLMLGNWSYLCARWALYPRRYILAHSHNSYRTFDSPLSPEIEGSKNIFKCGTYSNSIYNIILNSSFDNFMHSSSGFDHTPLPLPLESVFFPACSPPFISGYTHEENYFFPASSHYRLITPQLEPEMDVISHSHAGMLKGWGLQ